MQGAVFMPHNPQQGFSPSTALTVTEMEASPSPSQTTKEALTNHSADSGIFSATNNTTMNPAVASCETDSRSDCSSPERKYFCPICDKTMTSQHEFTLHIRSHNNQAGEAQDSDKGYTCRICSKVLCSSSSLDRHVLVHSGERPFHCKYCGDTFTTNGNMHRHMRTHSGKAESYESDGGSTDSGSSKSTEYNNNKVERRDKRKTETTADDTTKRQKTDRPTDGFNTFQCPVCERNDFDSAAILETHLEDNHPDHPAKCNQCKLVFLNNKLLTSHKSAAHESPGQRQPVVGFRDLTFVDFSSEKFPHIARMECEANLHKVSGGLRFQCGKCGRAFPCVNSLEIHEGCCVSRDHVRDADIDPGITRGDIRRMEFFSRLNLVDNSPEKPPPLPPLPNKLREHLVKAMDNTKDLADIQSILSNINLQQLHSKQEEQQTKPAEPTEPHKSDVQEEESQDVFAVEFRKMKLRGEFPCRLCTAVFPNLRALKGHNRAHLNGTNNGTYHCNMCPHSSLDKAALIRHMRTHNGDRPYECSLCNYAFTTKANCERHLRNRHSKTTREDVKKSIIYHPSEDPTNEDLNKLAGKDEVKKHNNYSNRIFTSTPKLPENEPTLPTVIPDMQALKPAKMFSSINDIIRGENLRALRKEHHVPISPLNFNAMTPQNLSTKIQVKSIEELGSRSFANESEEECVEEEEEEEEEQEQPLDLVLDLSKKKKKEEDVKRVEEEEPQDLTKKNFVPNTPPAVASTVDQLLGQQFLKTPPKIDPAALYATQLAFYRSGFAHLPNWPGFPLNPLLFPAALSQNPHDIKERIQRFQLCGGSMISEHGVPPPTFPRPPMSFSENFKKGEDLKPLTLHIDHGFGEKLQNPAQPPPQPPPPPPPKNNNDLLQSPNSVKMVIKNGVLMPKQKQRRYRTERPFTCEHCSARFTLRSNMERHIKQQHPQYWSQRQRSNIGTPGRKPQIMPIKPNYCDLSIPNYEPPKMTDYADTKDFLNEKLKFAILAQQLKGNQHHISRTTGEEDEDCALVIDEKEEKVEVKKEEEYDEEEEEEEEREEAREKVAEDAQRQGKNEENQDLVPVSRLLDNASQQQFREFFKREGEEHEVGLVSEEDEEGLVASGSTSEGNISGTDENRSESDTVQPVKKKSAYSLAPNRVSCPYCSRKFPWTSSLRRHILTHTGQKPFKCSHCPLLFTTKSNCDRHLLRKHGNAATTIPNDAPSNPNFLMRNVPERPFKCSSCPSSTFSTYSNLKKHISCKHSGDDIKAQGYEAGSSEDEKVPNEAKAPIDWGEAPVPRQQAQPPLPPPPASEPIASNSDLPFKCHLCEGSFSERQDALDHIKDKHASEYELLMSKNALDHNATTPEESHQDDDEGEMRGKFPDYSNRKVICAFCMRRFWSAEDLRRHMRTHTGERPFSCDICRRRFTLKHSMLRHRKKHNVNFEFDAVNSDEDAAAGGRNNQRKGGSSNESDGGAESGGDLISNLLGLRDRSIIDKVLTASADDAAKLLGVRNGAKE